LGLIIAKKHDSQLQMIQFDGVGGHLSPLLWTRLSPAEVDPGC